MSKASFEIAGIKFTDVDLGVCGISTVKYPSQEEAAAYERGRAAGRAEERADIVAMLWKRGELIDDQVARLLADGKTVDFVSLMNHEHEVITDLAIELEARAKAPAERQDGGERE